MGVNVGDFLDFYGGFEGHGIQFASADDEEAAVVDDFFGDLSDEVFVAWVEEVVDVSGGGGEDLSTFVDTVSVCMS